MTRPPQQDTPTLAYYVGWIVMIWLSFSIAWFWPPLVFVGGALVLHKSPRRGAFLRFLVHRIGRWLKLDSRRSQFLLLGTGLLVLMPLSAASGIKAHQAEVRRIEAERQAALYEQRRQQQLAEARWPDPKAWTLSSRDSIQERAYTVVFPFSPGGRDDGRMCGVLPAHGDGRPATGLPGPLIRRPVA